MVNFPSQQIERHNVPEVEFGHNKELMLPPILIARTEHEYCLIEASINSLRFSVKVKQGDMLEEILTKKFMRFITQRAEHFWILRRVPIEVSRGEAIILSSSQCVTVQRFTTASSAFWDIRQHPFSSCCWYDDGGYANLALPGTGRRTWRCFPSSEYDQANRLDGLTAVGHVILGHRGEEGG